MIKKIKHKGPLLSHSADVALGMLSALSPSVLPDQPCPLLLIAHRELQAPTPQGTLQHCNYTEHSHFKS